MQRIFKQASILSVSVPPRQSSVMYDRLRLQSSILYSTRSCWLLNDDDDDWRVVQGGKLKLGMI